MGELSERESLARAMYDAAPYYVPPPSSSAWDVLYSAALAWFAAHQPARVAPSAEEVARERVLVETITWAAGKRDGRIIAPLTLRSDQEPAWRDGYYAAMQAVVNHCQVERYGSRTETKGVETPDSLTARLVAARAATDGYRSEAERLRELLDEANAKIERMEEL